MQVNLRIAVWNANGLTNKLNEMEFFMKEKYIDIFLISETHLTTRSYVNIRGYDFIYTNHPDGKAHAGAGLFIKSTLKYEIAEECKLDYLQAAGVKVVCNNRPINIYAIYFPPRHAIKCEEYENFFRKLSHRFIAAGDYNAKHTWWGSRLTNPKGKQLYKCMMQNNFNTLSGGRPTYWPADPKKIPDLLDFAVYGGISRHSLDILNDDGLSSDHSPILINYNVNVELVPKKIKLITRNTNLNLYSEQIESKLNLNIKISTGDDLDDAVETLTSAVHEAALISTPHGEDNKNIGLKVRASATARDLIRQSRRLRKIWQRTKNPIDKTNWNLAIKLCSEFLAQEKNQNTGLYLSKLRPHNKNKEHDLYGATKYLKRPVKRNVPIKNANGLWCRSDEQKSMAFAEYLENTFKPNCTNTDDSDIMHSLDIACQLERPIRHITPSEIKQEINVLNNNKSTGFDKIDAKAIKSLPFKGIMFLTLIFNSILRLQHSRRNGNVVK